ncbi:unnamed protein product [Darwinula stevensoni]|uniref:Uncharacterized protein n=1 Tax=Darwinula stevensoni TaxID=69355 RepID=A0A7R8ZYP2_9CRUS|nr:unnamed protein product [Darwinula stevensoni]CAG0880954.1 unnamed protein product [Darwinula stevensoni]
MTTFFFEHWHWLVPNLSMADVANSPTPTADTSVSRYISTTLEKLFHGAFVAVSILAIPAWVLVNLKHYRAGKSS